MIEWAQQGREILAQQINMSPRDRAYMEAQIRAVELAAEMPVVIKRFNPEAQAGLKEVGHKFVWAIEAKPLAQLIDEGVIPGNYVNSSANLRSVVPVAREVAINTDQVVLPKSNNLSLDDQLGEVEKYVQGLRRKNLKRGSLDTVNFNLTNASVHVQLDRAYEAQTGKPLYAPRSGEYGLWVRTIDIADPGYVAYVGRDADDPGLSVDDWFAGDGDGLIWASPVAEPK